jgi:Rrf2 family protein
MFSQTAEYALRAMSVLAAAGESSMTTRQVATATQVPASYLSKVLQALRRADLVRSRRGIGGGVGLAHPASEITVLAIINAVDPINRITRCPLGLAAHGTQLCPMHSRLDEALAHVEQVFAGTTLAELLHPPAQRLPRCRFPSATARATATR